MKRTTLVSCNSVPVLPQGLLGHKGVPVKQIQVPVRTLCHHMYLDNHGPVVPRPNPIFGLFQGFVTPSPDLEFVTGSLGTHKDAKVGKSMELGKAFCRWFLYHHFEMTHFAHMDHVLGRTPVAPFAPTQVVRVKDGDSPDYLCANDAGSVFLAEAKGRQTGTIAFGNADFRKWRAQFKTVQAKNGFRNVKLKGFIVATRFRMEGEGKGIRTKLLAEDPESPGDEDPNAEERLALREIAVRDHYAQIFDKLAIPLQAESLRSFFLVPESQQVTVGLWKCLLPQLRDATFIGGLLPSAEHDIGFGWKFPDSFLRHRGWSPWLSDGNATFFGLELGVFKQMLARTRQQDAPTAERPIFGVDETTALPELVSILRDGTLMTASSFMDLINVSDL